MQLGSFARSRLRRPPALRALVLVALLLVGCTRGTPTATPTPLATPNANATPRTIIAPTGTTRKVDAILLEVLDTYHQHGRAEAEQLARDAGILDESNVARLTLVLTDTNTDPVAAKITASGGQVTGVSGNIVEIEVPLDLLLTYLNADGKDLMQDLAGFETVREVRVTPPMRTREPVAFPASGQRAVGPITSEGVAVSGADRWQAAGFYGQGVKIGIIDAGFGGYESLIGTELPPRERIQTRSYTSDRTLGKEVHGTAVAEVIHDMAPDASLWLVRVNSDATIDTAIRWLVDEIGVELISMSIGGVGVTREDGSSVAARAVDYAFTNGTLCIVAAGNEADSHYAAPFTDSDGDGYHEFAPGKTDLKVTPLGSQVEIALNWDAWTGPAVDLNLEVYDATGKLLRSSKSVQDTGGKAPVEYLSFSARQGQVFYVRIKGLREPRPVELNIFVQAGRPELTTPAGSLTTPGDAKFALTVGATRWDNDRLEDYSSQGPTIDGRIKPDIAGPTDIATASYPDDNERFNGTSAATPHVTGAAALFLGANPGATAEQIVAFLWDRALDLAPPGVDNQTGHGRLQLGEPPTGPAPPRPTAAPVASSAPGLTPVAPTSTARGNRLATPTQTLAPTRTATSTPTTAPKSTPTPAPPTPTRPTVRGTPGTTFADPLGGPGTGLPQGGETGYAEGQYRIAPSGANRAAWATYAAIYGDAQITATVQFVAAGPGAAGIVFWHASPSDYYLFAVSSDGYYQVGHFQGERWTAVIPWTKAPAIVQGGPNNLQVATIGTQLTVSANGQQLASVSDPGGGSGAVGMLATSFDQPGIVAGFTNFAVRAGP